jgi:phospholipid/cholesterol/gamma-HCH transport system substrate-binding protein
VPASDKLLGKGTKQPGLHVQAVIVPVYNNARYLPGVDTPKYGDNLGPHCYAVPFKGITLNDGTTPLSGGTPAAGGPGASGTGASGTGVTTRAAIAGTPAESELVRELAGLALDKPTAKVPAWSSLLLAPLFRGATVNLASRS